MKNRSVVFVSIIVVLGIIKLLIDQLLRSTGGATEAVQIIIWILAAVTIFFAGRISKSANGNPIGWGALLGAIGGLFAGAKGFFTHVTLDQLQQKIQGQSIPPELLKKAVETANSTKMHVITLIVHVVIYIVIGLIIALVGGATTKRKDK
jgi:hypothetical protein